MTQVEGYGEDPFCENVRTRIRQAIGCPDADVFFLVGGTQTNSTVIDAMLRRYEGVVAVETGHIAVHESGEVEFSVLDIPRFKCFKATRLKSMKTIISPLVFARLQ